jgi:hypothetical protein
METNKKTYSGVRKVNTVFNTILNDDFENILGNQKIYKSVKNKQSGGADKPSILPYRAEKNDPFKTNDQRTTFNKKQEDIVQPRMPPVLLEQKVYDTSVDKAPRPQAPPSFVPIYTDDGVNILPYNNMINPAYKEPMQKVYNISLSNPLHDFTTVSRIYEDIIPGDPRSFTFTTLYERTEFINFVKNLINDNMDGENMNVVGGKNTLLSSIKLLELNPYTLNKHPYKDLARDFLIYSAAYPIRYNEEKHNIFVAKSAHGLNVRIYNISLGEMIGNKINQNLDNFNFDIWRELKYYEYIRSHIIKKKISPNFLTYILYKMDTLSNVNWNKLNEIQKRTTDDFKNKLKF